MSALPQDDHPFFEIGEEMAHQRTKPQSVKVEMPADDAEMLIASALTPDGGNTTTTTAPPKLPIDVLSTSVENARRTIKVHLPRFWMPMRAALAMTAALRLSDLDLCIATVFAGPSGVGKGTMFAILEGGTGTVRVDSVTPQCFVSGHADSEVSPDVRKKDILPLIQHRLMLTKDASTIFNQNSDQLKRLFGVLVPILDGNGYAPAFGTHGLRSVTGNYRFAWAIASVPFASQTWQAHNRFGSRLGFYNLFKPVGMTDEEVLAERNGAPLPAKIGECQKCVHAVLNRIFAVKANGQLPGPLPDATLSVAWKRDPYEVEMWRVKFARFLSACRKERGRSGNIAEVEEEDEADPQRAISFLEAVTRGNAMLDDRTAVTEEDLPLAVHYALSGSRHGRVLTALAHHPDDLSVAKCAHVMGWSVQTAENRMNRAVEQGVVQWVSPKVAMHGVGAPTQKVLAPAGNWSWLGDLKARGWLQHSVITK